MNMIFKSLLAIAILFTISVNTKADKVASPDFAYPKQVSQQAEANLNKALKESNGKLVVKSLIEYAVAQDMINSDSTQLVINKIENLAAKENDPCTKALLNALLLKIYCNIYDSDAWTYNSRTAISSESPTDLKEWSKADFEQKAIELCDKIFSDSDALKNAQLRNYSGIINFNNATLLFYPTLYDFAISHAISALDNFANHQVEARIMPYNKLLTDNSTYSNDINNRINTLYRNVLSFHTNDIAPFINWDIDRLTSYLYWDTGVPMIDDSPDNNARKYEEALNALFLQFQHSEYASMALLEMYQWIDNSLIYSHREMFQMLSTRLKQFPAYYGNCEIKNAINNLSHKALNINFNRTVAPYDTLTISITNANNKEYTIEILRLPDDALDAFNSYGSYTYKKGSQPNVYQSFSLTNGSIIPFTEKKEIKTIITQPGYYSVIAYSDSVEKKLRNLNVIHCTGLFITKSNAQYNTEKRIWIVDPKTGSPVNNATINIYKRNRNDGYKLLQTFSSTKEGKLKSVLDPYNAYRITTQKGEDKFAYSESLYTNHNEIENDDENTWARVFTALAVYHPGDTVQWSAVMYHANHSSMRLSQGDRYTISLRDANYMEIDTMVVTTDSFGRAEGKFRIPTDRMTGNYSVSVIGRFNRHIGNARFKVSDYKLPTFDITISSINKEDNGNYIINGEVKSFSGFALEGASASLALSNRSFYWSSDNTAVGQYTTTSDVSGKFSFTIEAGTFAQFPPHLIYKAEITATSTNGESQVISQYFTQGNQYHIQCSLSGEIEASKSTPINVNIIDINDNLIDGEIHYSIINDQKQVVKQGSLPSTASTIDLSDVPSGKCDIKLYSIAPTVSDTLTCTFWLYRLTDSRPPCDEGIWIQHNNYTIAKDNSIEIVYGAAFDSGNILYLLYDDNKIYEQRWIKTKAGIHKTRVFIPQNVDNAKLTLYTVNNYKSYNCNADIRRASSIKSLKITAESFRDKSTPGSEEQWTFKVTDNSGTGKESAMIFDMYSVAIDKISPHNFSLSFPPISISTISLNALYKSNYHFAVEDAVKSSSCPDIESPTLNTYNHYFGVDNRHNVVTYGITTNACKSLNGGINMAKDISYDGAEEEVSEHEVLRTEPQSKKLASTTVDASSKDDTPNITLRENETPLAFFSPMLTTDSVGNLTYSFTAPNANTTWQFCAIAFNHDMVAANFAQKVLSNKPIMVQPNMPRFLRQGDNATIKATVMNNSDSTLSITTIIEIFDPTTAKVISTHKQTDMIEASKSVLVSRCINASFDASMIGYRIKSFSDDFSDGEQSLLPILPSTSPVIETYTFYIGADENSITKQLPTMPADARVTFELCNNPTWYAVSALPGLNKNESRSSTSAAMAIYSAAIADGIIRQNPRVAKALYQWQTSNKTDSALVSMLSRNQDLKNMLLNATPWVQCAESDTERMTRLALLFDKKSTKATLDKNIHLLSTLQRSGGGWAWIAESDEASIWATLSILEKIGHLKRIRLLPENKMLNSMVENAIKYIDAEFAKQYKEYPKGDYSRYVYIRDMFPELKQSTAARKVTDASIQKIIADWKNYSLEKKALSAIILNNNNYSATAHEILNSIGEFAQSSASRGMWWPAIENRHEWNFDKVLAHVNILDAYQQVSPNSKDIDKIRQWLIINKGANNWGNSSATSYAIYTLIRSGSRWSVWGMECEILIGGETITPSNLDNDAGYLRTNISALSPSAKKLVIAKHTDAPTWGAVYSQYQAEMSNIKAVNGDDISIEKKLLKQVGDSWVVANDLSVGDRIRVQLTIKTKRDLQYVTVNDERAACFEPTEQLPKPIFAEGLSFYRENRNDATNIFVTYLPKGTYMLNYDLYVNNEGTFASGLATIQSQYAPQVTAHSTGNIILVK